MGRVALVTGGSRGIGEAISKALKDAGYEVAATYAGNDEKAAAFTAATGIKTYKWDVANYEASAAGIAQVEADLGPIEVVVANAGIGLMIDLTSSGNIALRTEARYRLDFQSPTQNDWIGNVGLQIPFGGKD